MLFGNGINVLLLVIVSSLCLLLSNGKFSLIFKDSSLIGKCIGEEYLNKKCDEDTVNMHMLQCYKEYIDQTVDITSPENAFYMEGSLLCQFVFIQFLYLLYKIDFCFLKSL